MLLTKSNANQVTTSLHSKTVFAKNIKLLLQFARKNHEIFSEDLVDKNNDKSFEMSTENLQQLETSDLFF